MIDTPTDVKNKAQDTLNESAPFPSLAALRRENAALLKARRAEPDSREVDERIYRFMRRVRATGARLDALPDRETAQTILDYWTTTFLTQPHPSSQHATPLESFAAAPSPTVAPSSTDAVLADFDADHAREVANVAEKTLQELSEDDRELVRRILLRLVRLPADGRTFELDAKPRADLESLAEPQRVRNLLERLQKAGIVRQLEEDAVEQFALANESLMSQWPTLARWLEQRVRFRDTVRFWDRSGRSPAALIGGQLLDEARTYHDPNATERDYIDGSRARELRLSRNMKWWIVALAVLAVTAALGWIYALSQASQARTAEAAAIKANDDLKVANANKQFLTNMNLVVRTLAEVGTARNPAERQMALRRWELVTKNFRNDVTINGFLERNQAELNAALKDTTPRSVDGGNQIAREALALARNLKKMALELNDRDVIAGLEAKRAVAFATVDFCTQEIVKEYRVQAIEQADPYVKEFWTLYYGELGYLEGQLVEKAMVKFGIQLEQVYQVMFAESVSPSKKDGELGKGIMTDIKKYTSQEIVSAATKLLPKQKANIETLLKKNVGSKHFADEVTKLETIRVKTLLPALAEELRRGIESSSSPPQGY